jgi:hypothetical protein
MIKSSCSPSAISDAIAQQPLSHTGARCIAVQRRKTGKTNMTTILAAFSADAADHMIQNPRGKQ